MDGFDLGAIAYVAPGISVEWGLSSSELGAVFSVGLLGLAVGALLIAPMADNFGRRPAIVGAAVLAGVAMLGAAQSPSLTHLIVARFFTGMGVGVLIPVLTTFAREVTPSKARNISVALIVSIGTVGSVAGGLLAAQFLEDFGWRPILFGGGILTLVISAVALFRLPESPAYLAKSRRPDALAKANVALTKMGVEPLLALPRTEAVATVRVASLFAPGFRRPTLILWFVFLLVNLHNYFVVSWTPQMMVSLGLTLQLSTFIGIAFPVGASIGAIVVAMLSRWWTLQRVVTWSFGAGCIAVIGLGLAVQGAFWYLAMALSFLSGFFVNGAFASVFTITTSYYPATTRATAIGWCIGVSRVGAVLGPAVAGIALDQGLAVFLTYWLFSLPVVAAVLLLNTLPTRPAEAD